MKRRLSPRTVRALKPGKDGVRRGDIIMDDLAPNLGVRVLGTPERPEWTFVFVSRFPREKSSARIAIGKFYKASGDTEAEKATELASLQSAREKAWKWYNLLKDGRDPRLEAKRERDAELHKQAHTFKSVAELFITDKLPKERRGSDVEADIRREFLPLWGTRPIVEIDEREIKRCIKAKAKTKQEQARNLLGHIKRLMQWAKDQDDYGLKVNPAAAIKASAVGIGKKLKREHRLNDTELRAFWRAASRLPYPTGPVYRLLLLTGLRLNEAAEACWDEFHPALVRALRTRNGGPVDWSKFDHRQLTWIIPASRMKGRNDSAREHAVPLTADILAVLEQLPHFAGGAFLFSHTGGEKPAIMSTDKKAAMDRRILQALRALARKHGEDPAAAKLRPWRNHDLRRNVRSGLSSLSGIREEVREALLAHARPGISGNYDVYDYLSEKRDALEKWAALLHTIVEPARMESNVVALRG